ncbi:alkaline phosphatase [Paremcibacter congregatus]|uniref:alkaline phosphatase n=1 Tax=Paremcibacter congregatus TaxID=2043170 RepID=UPI0030EC626E
MNKQHKNTLHIKTTSQENSRKNARTAAQTLFSKTRLVGLGTVLLAGAALYALPGIAGAEEVLQANDSYYTKAQETLSRKLAQKINTRPAKNVILFIGDGMSITTVTAIRILQGQMHGRSGEENVLSWEEFPHTALSKTYNSNQQVPDSAGTASAFMTGAKTKAGVINVNQTVPRGDCGASHNNHLESILELSEKAGINTGIVTTARLTHATPAAAYAHAPERGWENDSEIPQAERNKGCKDIAQQFVDFSLGDGIEVAFGGGRSNFLPHSLTDEEGKKGNRTDKRNLVEEWQTKHPDGRYVWNQKGFDALDPNAKGPVLGLFNASHMNYEPDRAADKGKEPSLADMTRKAIQSLEARDDGYFLYVEGARIDHGHHGGNAYRALHDGVALADAVQAAKEMTNGEDTLIIVTSDHSHGFVMTGYATLGNPILGKVVENDAHGEPQASPALALDDGPYTTVGYYTGSGAPVRQPRSDLTHVDTEAKNFKQQAIVPTKSEKHGGEDVAIYARGPGAYLFQGVVEQNYIFHVMQHALRLKK